MRWVRECSRPGCSHAAVATLTYVYRDRTAVLGPLGPRREPGSYDMCTDHAERLSAPRGWEIIRLPGIEDSRPATPPDDLAALAAVVREVGMLSDELAPLHDPVVHAPVHVLGRRGHLAVIADAGTGAEDH